MQTVRVIIFCIVLLAIISCNIRAEEEAGRKFEAISKHYKLDADQTGRLIMRLFTIYEQEDLVLEDFPSTFNTTENHQQWFDTPDLTYSTNKTYISTISDNSTKISNNPGHVSIAVVTVPEIFQISDSNYRLGTNTQSISPMDRHVLFGKVHRLSQQLLFDDIKKYGYSDPLSLKVIFEGITTSIIFQVKLKKKIYYQISIDKINARCMGIENIFSSLTLETNKTNIDRLSPEKQIMVNRRIENLRKKLLGEEDLNRPYPSTFELIWTTFDNEYPFLRYLIRKPFSFQLIQLLIITFVGFFIIFIIIKQRQGKTHSMRDKKQC